MASELTFWLDPGDAAAFVYGPIGSLGAPSRFLLEIWVGRRLPPVRATVTGEGTCCPLYGGRWPAGRPLPECLSLRVVFLAVAAAVLSLTAIKDSFKRILEYHKCIVKMAVLGL